jgi:putative oxidoreductase
MNTIAAFVGRIMLAALFIVSGLNKLFALAATKTLLTSVGLSPDLALPTALFELIAGIALLLGFLTRAFSLLLAGFCLLVIVFYHRDFSDPVQTAMAFKNVAISGGLLCLFAHQQMVWSYDSMRISRRNEHAARVADERAHDADLRAARAETRTEMMGAGNVRTIPTVNFGHAQSDETRRRWWNFR